MKPFEEEFVVNSSNEWLYIDYINAAGITKTITKQCPCRASERETDTIDLLNEKGPPQK